MHDKTESSKKRAKSWTDKKDREPTREAALLSLGLMCLGHERGCLAMVFIPAKAAYTQASMGLHKGSSKPWIEAQQQMHQGA